MVTDFNSQTSVVIILQNTQLLNHYVVHLRLIQCYMPIIPQKKIKTLKRSKLRCIIASVKKTKDRILEREEKAVKKPQ